MDCFHSLIPEPTLINYIPIECRYVDLGVFYALPMHYRDGRVEQSTYLQAYTVH